MSTPSNELNYSIPLWRGVRVPLREGIFLMYIVIGIVAGPMLWAPSSSSDIVGPSVYFHKPGSIRTIADNFSVRRVNNTLVFSVPNGFTHYDFGSRIQIQGEKELLVYPYSHQTTVLEWKVHPKPLAGDPSHVAYKIGDMERNLREIKLVISVKDSDGRFFQGEAVVLITPPFAGADLKQYGQVEKEIPVPAIKQLHDTIAQVKNKLGKSSPVFSVQVSRISLHKFIARSPDFPPLRSLTNYTLMWRTPRSTAIIRLD